MHVVTCAYTRTVNIVSTGTNYIYSQYLHSVVLIAYTRTIYSQYLYIVLTVFTGTDCVNIGHDGEVSKFEKTSCSTVGLSLQKSTAKALCTTPKNTGLIESALARASQPVMQTGQPSANIPTSLLKQS
jgi:hypothetical protein